jgi:hypothetical protein
MASEQTCYGNLKWLQSVLSQPLLVAVLFALWLLYNLNDNADMAHNVPNCTFNIDETTIIKKNFKCAHNCSLLYEELRFLIGYHLGHG